MKTTENKGLEALIDWVQVTFHTLSHWEIMRHILQFDPELMEYEGYGRFRYSGKWHFGGIELLTPPDNYPAMGYHLYLTGSACRALEIYLGAQRRNWYDFFASCLQHGGSFTRLDIAIDDRKPYFAIRRLNEKIKKGECVSKFHKRVCKESGTIKGESTGNTLNLGSGESLCHMVLYEKNYERSQSTGLPPEHYGPWNRYEVRLRQEMATECVKNIVSRKEICFIGLEIINTYLRLTVKNSEDENRARWKTWKPWAVFMADMEKLQLSMHPAPRSLEQKKQWIAKAVAPTLKMIQMADDHLGENFLRDIVAQTVLTRTQGKLVEDYLRGRWELEREEGEDGSELSSYRGCGRGV